MYAGDLGKIQINILKLNASPAGGARIMRIVMAHLTKYGPSGVPKGRVDAQKRGKGRTPCLCSIQICDPARENKQKRYLPHSRMTLDWPMSTAMRLPNALRAIRKLRPLTAPLEPKTFWKNKLAAICVDCSSCVFETIIEVRGYSKNVRESGRPTGRKICNIC